MITAARQERADHVTEVERPGEWIVRSHDRHEVGLSFGERHERPTLGESRPPYRPLRSRDRPGLKETLWPSNSA